MLQSGLIFTFQSSVPLGQSFREASKFLTFFFEYHKQTFLQRRYETLESEILPTLSKLIFSRIKLGQNLFIQMFLMAKTS